MLQKRLSDISEIPSKLDKLIDRIEKSNDRLVSSVSAKMDNTAEKIWFFVNLGGNISSISVCIK